MSDNPYATPRALPPAPVRRPGPPLAKVALAYGGVGTLTAMLLTVTVGPVLLDSSTELAYLVGPWLAAGTASFVVPTLVHAVLGRRWWHRRRGRVLLAFLSVLCAVEACLIGDLIVVVGIQGRDIFVPPLSRMLAAEAIPGLALTPVGMLPAWWVGRGKGTSGE